MAKCPRQDPNDFRMGDILEIDCPKCGNSIEFIGNESERKCSQCGETVVNASSDAG